MYRIVYKNDFTRVLLLGASTEAECIEFLQSKKLNAEDYVIQKRYDSNGHMINYGW